MSHTTPNAEWSKDQQAIHLLWNGASQTQVATHILAAIARRPLPAHKIPQLEREYVLSPVDEDIEKVLDFLLLGILPPSGLLARYRWALLAGPSAAMLHAFRAGLNRRLLQVWQEMRRYQSLEIAPHQDQVDWWQLQINNILSYLTYAGCPTGTHIEIPQYLAASKTWELVPYEVTRLQLTPGWFGSPYYAYGLTSTKPDAKSLLLFMGTTYPGGNGFLWTLLADMTPFMSVGSLLFRLGKKVLKKWVATQRAANKDIDCHGQSLGGALSILAADAFKKDGLKSYAMVPAGRLGPTQDASNVTVIFGGRDPICQVGDMPQGARFVYVCPSEKQAATALPDLVRTPGLRGSLYSHMAGLSWQQGAKAYEVDRAMIAEKPGKKIWTYLWYATWILSPVFWVIKILSIPVYAVIHSLRAVWRRMPNPSKKMRSHSEKKSKAKKRTDAQVRSQHTDTLTMPDQFERMLTYHEQRGQNGDEITSASIAYTRFEPTCRLTMLS